MVTESLILVLNYYYAKKLVTDMKIFDIAGFMQACVGAMLFVPVIFLVKKYVPGELLMLVVSFMLCFVFYILLQLFVLRNQFALYLEKMLKQYISKVKTV